MSGLFWSLPLLVAMVKLTITSSDDQIYCCILPCSEGKVQGVVAKVVTFEHLVLKKDLILVVYILATTDFDLGDIVNECSYLLLSLLEIAESFNARTLAN